MLRQLPQAHSDTEKEQCVTIFLVKIPEIDSAANRRGVFEMPQVHEPNQKTNCRARKI